MIRIRRRKRRNPSIEKNKWIPPDKDRHCAFLADEWSLLIGAAPGAAADTDRRALRVLPIQTLQKSLPDIAQSPIQQHESVAEMNRSLTNHGDRSASWQMKAGVIVPFSHTSIYCRFYFLNQSM